MIPMLELDTTGINWVFKAFVQNSLLNPNEDKVWSLNCIYVLEVFMYEPIPCDWTQIPSEYVM